MLHQAPKTLIALTGPSGVGKTTMARLLTRALPDDTEEAPILTTRAPKEHDDGEYRYVTGEAFQALANAGVLVARTRLPASGEERRYGYCVADLDRIHRKGKMPVVITEMHLLQGFVAHYGRRAIFSCGLLPPGEDTPAMLRVLLERLRIRARDSEESIRGRLRNAERDLAFFRERGDLFDCLLVNGDVDTAVRRLLKRVGWLTFMKRGSITPENERSYWGDSWPLPVPRNPVCQYM